MKIFRPLFLAALSVGLLGFSSAAKASVTFDFSVFEFSNNWTKDRTSNTNPIYLFGSQSGTAIFDGAFTGSNGQITGFSGSYRSTSDPLPSPSAYAIITESLTGTYNQSTLVLESLNFRFQIQGNPIFGSTGPNYRLLEYLSPDQDYPIGQFQARTFSNGNITNTDSLDVQAIGQITGVPEIDGKMLPQVALLLGSLYMLFVFGRSNAGRRELASPALARAA